MPFNTLDYLLWRGDLTFDKSPINLVDQFIFSQLSTPDYQDIVSSGKKETSVEEASEAYFKTHSDDYESIGVLQSRYVLTMFSELCRTERFRHAVLCGYGSRIRYEKEEQFAAVTIRLSDDLACVSFRGTDDTLIGWKEDCNLAVMDRVPAQRDAVEYLKRVAKKYPGRLMTTGHSKGGNLAIYAAASVPQEIRSRIISAVSFDGPGFRDDFLSSEGYLEIKDRVITVLPQNSIVGTLLNMAGTPVYVHSSMKGPLTHDGFNWDVLGTDFIRETGLGTISGNIKEIVAETLERMSDSEKETFIDTLFSKMTATGARSVTELSKLSMLEKARMLKAMKNDPCLSDFADRIIQVTKETIFPDMLSQLA
ncbi:MAG: DUF2974 domain-containing protein [Clostridia bacterium]|nr:DUF2974 domain-containing protein [Clostridia bacterium]